MRVLVTGAAGFVGSTLIGGLLEARAGMEIVGFDNLYRPGSEANRSALGDLGVAFVHGDLRLASDVDALPPVDWVIDAAALPSVLSGLDPPEGSTGRRLGSSRQTLEHNLIGTINLLEACKRNQAGLVLLSTSRVYSMEVLAGLPVIDRAGGFELDVDARLPEGVTADGVSESCSTAPPVSLYGASKVASEQVALEYAATFDLPVWVDRCGVLAGPGQFGGPAQGIYAYWVHAHRERAPLTYLGFGGTGSQVRDCLHPRDLVGLVLAQMDAGLDRTRPPVLNIGGGIDSAWSLRELTAWCEDRFGSTRLDADPVERRFDLPWVVLDAARAADAWDWRPTTGVPDILEEIARHAEAHPDWLTSSGA